MRNVYVEMAPIFIKHAHLNKTKTFYFQLSMSDFGVGRTHLEIEKLCMNMIRGQDESFRCPGPFPLLHLGFLGDAAILFFSLRCISNFSYCSKEITLHGVQFQSCLLLHLEKMGIAAKIKG